MPPFLLVFLIAAAAPQPPNVVFITVDTLRADHLGCYGYAKPVSPRIDALARESLLFEDCVCETPLTNPSFCAMFTSKFPRTLGVHRNALALPKDSVTITMLFQRAGYDTICVQSNWTLKGDLSGLNAGFRLYEDSFNVKRWGLFKGERYAGDVTAKAIEAIKAREPGKPIFAWIHYSDPHAPYRFHEQHNPWGPKWKQLDAIQQTRARYDSEIAYVDYQIGLLLDALPTENTFVVFTSDHGESLYEHDYLGHGRRIYQNNLHIPLMLKGPGITPGRSKAPARGVDIGPTLLGLAGLPALDDAEGVDLVKAPPDAARPRVVETYGGAIPNVPGLDTILTNRPPQRQGVLLEGWKLILRDKSPELYNLTLDPGELKDLAGKEPDRVVGMRRLIETWTAEHPTGEAQAVKLTEEDKEALEAGGYLGRKSKKEK